MKLFPRGGPAGTRRRPGTHPSGRDRYQLRYRMEGALSPRGTCFHLHRSWHRSIHHNPRLSYADDRTSGL